MKRLAVIAAAGAALVAASLANSLTAAPVQAETGQIVFQSDRTGNSEIWVMNLDGSDQRQLTKNGFADASPAWTPDGDVVFASTRGGSWDIWKMDANGQNAVLLTPGSEDSNEFDPAVSADGDVAFEGNARGNWDIYRLPGGAPSPRPTLMTPESGVDDFDPSYSLDGTEIVFSTGTKTSFRISRVFTESPGRGIKPIQTPIPLSFDPAWSPDGNDIAFTRQDGATRSIVRMEADGQNVKPLTSGGADDWGPVWTGEGHIVFTRSTDDAVGGSYHLYEIDENGGSEKRLTGRGRGINVEPAVRLTPDQPQRRPASALGGAWALATVKCKAGTARDDNLVGTAGPDCIVGLAGNDTIEGRGGDDLIYGGAGSDHILGGHGVDSLYGRGGDDSVYGNFGNDRIWGGPGADSLYGGLAADRIFAADGEPDLITGGPGAGDEVFADENDVDVVDKESVIH